MQKRVGHRRPGPREAKDRNPDEPQPPEAPEVRRRLRPHRYQWIGLPLLFAIPLSALFGVFDDRVVTTRAVTDALEISVRHPAQLRYQMRGELSVRVRNISRLALDSLTVSFPPAYMEAFSNVQFVPSPDDAYQVRLAGIEPGGEKLITVEFEANRYWRHRGQVQVEGGGGTSVAIETFVFP